MRESIQFLEGLFCNQSKTTLCDSKFTIGACDESSNRSVQSSSNINEFRGKHLAQNQLETLSSGIQPPFLKRIKVTKCKTQKRNHEKRFVER
jgi:hypothetical protein